MTSFFSKITNVVGDAYERINLDAANKEIIDGFDAKVKSYMDASTDLSIEDAQRLEQQWMNAGNAKYDEKALSITGRRIPANWSEGDPDLICVRKRMLNRQFNERKGRLYEGVKNSAALTVWRLNDLKFNCVRSVENFDLRCRDSMPLNHSRLRDDYNEMISELQAKISDEYPGGLSRFQSDSVSSSGASAWQEINNHALKVFEELVAVNSIAVEQAKDMIFKKIVSKIVNDLRIKAHEMAELQIGAVIPDTMVIPVAEAVVEAPSDLPILDFLTHSERLEFAQRVRNAAIQCIINPVIDKL
jgi:polyhydroxyalkanoate synthesis regulator phasin